MALCMSTITYTAYLAPIHTNNVGEENLTLSFLLVQWRIRPWALLLCGFVENLSELFFICDSVFHSDLIGNMPLSYRWEENKIWAFTYTTFWITSANMGTYLDFFRFFGLFFIFANMPQNVKNNPQLHKWAHPRSTNCYWIADDSMCQTASIFVGGHSVTHNGQLFMQFKKWSSDILPSFCGFPVVLLLFKCQILLYCWCRIQWHAPPPPMLAPKATTAAAWMFIPLHFPNHKHFCSHLAWR